MMRSQPRFIFLFLDGVGLGRAQASNPLAVAETVPYLTNLLGELLLADVRVQRPKLLCQPIDACLGVPGLPQSATGQTSLFTGCNASAFLGKHLSAFANGSLRSLIDAHGMFKQMLASGGTVTHANLYSPAYFEAIAQRRRRYSVGTLVTLTAGVPFRMGGERADQIGISWDITGQFRRDPVTPAIAPDVAGQRLAAIGAQHHLTLFECYLPDYAGHNQDLAQAQTILQLVDRFIASVVQHLSWDVTLNISSDHGNVEDLSHKHHTLNPVPLVAIGAHAAEFAMVSDITGITPKILELFSDSQGEAFA